MNDKLFIDIALLISKQSKCTAAQVGAVIVKNKRIISMGYNGTVSNSINCDEALEQGLYDESTHSDWSSINEIHAEMNALMFAVKHGISVDGCTLYVTHEPCDNCLKHLIQAGIKNIKYKYSYKSYRNKSIYRNKKYVNIEKIN